LIVYRPSYSFNISSQIRMHFSHVVCWSHILSLGNVHAQMGIGHVHIDLGARLIKLWVIAILLAVGLKVNNSVHSVSSDCKHQDQQD